MLRFILALLFIYIFLFLDCHADSRGIFVKNLETVTTTTALNLNVDFYSLYSVVELAKID